MNNDNKISKKTRKKRFNLLLTDDEYQFLKKISQIENKSISEILRDAVDYLYNPENKEETLKNLDLIFNKNYFNHSNNLEKYINHYTKNNL
ncbi:MAG: hypothetical protein KatS3mg129_0913 [Leptospiraceae bacterium]|nr:MAG: hypothetical protein KatS3mg129_0913 [Leptospiraceae bacterium]